MRKRPLIGRGNRRTLLTRLVGSSTIAFAMLVVPFASSEAPRPHSPIARFHASQAGIPRFRHVFVVLMENLGYRSAIATPGIAALANRYALATNYYSVAHPSLPNYLALTSGSTWGINSDCVECFVRVPNLAEQLHDAHISFGAYMEGVPTRCFLADYGGTDYAAKHDPFRYYDDVRSNRGLCDAIRPESELPALLSAPAGGVPRFVWVTPDLCHDGHDCPPSIAASWLGSFIHQVTQSAAWRSNGVLFVTWDESDSSDATVVPPGRVVSCCGGGQVATLVIAQNVRRGLRVNVAYSHYSLLATIEDAFGLPLLGNAAHAASMSAFFRPIPH